MPSHYQVLGLENDASDAQIRAAYTAKLLLLHPDKRGGDDDGVEELQAVKTAYHILSSKPSRDAYDARINTYLPSLVHDTVSIAEFQQNDDGEFLLECRCGGSFALERDEINQVDIVPCDTCSLCVRVQYGQ